MLQLYKIESVVLQQIFTKCENGVGEIFCDLVVLRITRSGIQPQIERKRTPTTNDSIKTVTMKSTTGIKTLIAIRLKFSLMIFHNLKYAYGGFAETKSEIPTCKCSVVHLSPYL